MQSCVHIGCRDRTAGWRWIAGLAALAAASCRTSDADRWDDITFSDHVHTMPLSTDPQPAATGEPPAGAHLLDLGGKVIQNVRITQVLYGPGTYQPELTSSSGVTMASAYSQMVTSGVFDWLAEYNTTSPAQSIGRGAFQRAVQIAPDASRNGALITDADIQRELAAQIRGGALPAPDDDQLYMVSFPSETTVMDPAGDLSCAPGGFCAYHGTFRIGAQNVYYSVLPALTRACATGCGAGTPFQNQQLVASHELVDAMTDAEVGLARARPSTSSAAGAPAPGWVDPPFVEISDLCIRQQSAYTGTDGNSYTVQPEFSNRRLACFASSAEPVTPPEIANWKVAGDLNGDGLPDLVTTVYTAPGLRTQTLLSTGPGTWQFLDQLTRFDYATDDMANWKVAGDLNGDGRPDLIDTFFVNPGLRVHALLSVGPGVWGFTYQDVQADYALDDMANWKVAGDLNGDGLPDLVDTVYLGQPGSGGATGLRVQTLLSTGTATWTLMVQDVEPDYSVDDMANWKVAGDLNGDGRPDLVDLRFLAPGLRVQMLLSTGPGTWQFTFQDVRPNYLTDDMANWKVAGDLNGDGRPDLVDTFFLGRLPGGTSGLRVHTLLTTGPGRWEYAFQDVQPDYPVDDMANWKVAGDLNGDGRPDLVDTFFLAPGLRVQTLLTTGPGTWQFELQNVRADYASDDTTNWKIAPRATGAPPGLIDTLYLGPNGPGQPSGLRVQILVPTAPGRWQFVYQDADPGYTP